VALHSSVNRVTIFKIFMAARYSLPARCTVHFTTQFRFFIPRRYRRLCSQRSCPRPHRPALRANWPPSPAGPDRPRGGPASSSPSPVVVGPPRTTRARRHCHRPRTGQPHTARVWRRCPHLRLLPACPMPALASMAHTALAPAAKEARRHQPPAPESRHHCLLI
jgi:hypothetical protein